MYIAFEFGNGSNPYVTTTGEKLFHMFCKYYTEQFTSNTFVVLGERKWNGNRQTKQGRKEVLRAIAKEWQIHFGEFDYSALEVAEWTNFFETYGRKYGLLREFRENGIC